MPAPGTRAGGTPALHHLLGLLRPPARATSRTQVWTHSAAWSPDDMEIAVITVAPASTEAYRIAIIENARELLLGSSTTPQLAAAPLVSSGDVLTIDHLDWSRRH